MGPTCSLVYENEPLEKNSMTKPPRLMTTTFLNWRELSISILQGVVIACGTIGIYYYAICQGYNEMLTRSMVFTTLVVANILLTLVDRSFYYSIFTALKYKNNLLVIILVLTATLLISLLYIPFMQHFFGFAPLSILQLGISSLVGFVSVIWFELYKLIKRQFSQYRWWPLAKGSLGELLKQLIIVKRDELPISFKIITLPFRYNAWLHVRYETIGDKVKIITDKSASL